MKEFGIIVLKSIAVVIGAIFAIALVMAGHQKDAERCEARGGHLGWLCVDKDGNHIPER